jgi:hypothetical protein
VNERRIMDEIEKRGHEGWMILDKQTSKFNGSTTHVDNMATNCIIADQGCGVVWWKITRPLW